MASSRDFRRVYHSLWGSQGFVLGRPSLAEKPSAYGKRRGNVMKRQMRWLATSMLFLTTVIVFGRAQSIEMKAKIPFDFVAEDRALPAGEYVVTRLGSGFAGHYRVSFPAGTFQIGSPYVFPPALVTPLFSAATPDVNYYVIFGDQSGVFEVDFAGVDTYFSFNLTQIY